MTDNERDLLSREGFHIDKQEKKKKNKKKKKKKKTRTPQIVQKRKFRYITTL